MDSERWQNVDRLYHEAMEHEESQRAAFLTRVCGGDEALLREVESLVSYGGRSGRFIEGSALEVVAPALAGDGGDGHDPTYDESQVVGKMIGKRISQYRIVEQVGVGGMGEVYRAVRADDQYQKQVAIKLVRAGEDSGFVISRFKNERQILASLDHPNIARLHDGGATDEGVPYFVMELVEGQPIDMYCDTHKLGIPARLKLFLQVCSALQYAHQRQIIHRDIKPANILVTAQGVPKLLDFGIAKILDSGVGAEVGGKTQTMFRAFTPEYASPEQIKAEPISTASDVYSLGVLLYELLTGHRPYRFKTRTPAEIEQAICEEEPLKPSTVVTRAEERTLADGTTNSITPEKISQARDSDPKQMRSYLVGDLDAIVMMALRKEPHRRYASVDELAGDIHRHLERLPITARPSTLAYRGAKFVHRHRELTLSGLIFLLLLGGLAIVLETHQRSAHPSVESLAVLPFSTDVSGGAADYLTDGITEGVINDLSQVPRLRVMARSTVFRFKGKDIDPQQLGGTLRVDAVVTGHITQQSNELAVQAELVSARDGSQIWGEQFSRKMADISSLQGDVAREISSRLRFQLTGEEQQRIAGLGTQSQEAYQLYLKGRFHLAQRTESSMRQAIQDFRQAVALDPSYAQAWASLSLAYSLAVDYLPGHEAETLPSGKEEAERAVELDHGLSEAHVALAEFHGLRYDWDGAEREFKFAIEANPNDANAHYFYALLVLHPQRRFDEAFPEFRKALTLDPLSVIINTNYAVSLEAARRFDEAREQFRKALELDQNFTIALYRSAEFEAYMGNFPTAVQQLTRANPKAAKLDFGTGKEAFWQALLRLGEHVGETGLALAMLGKKDEAFREFDRSLEEEPAGVTENIRLPGFDSVRSDPRYAALLRRVNLSQ
jgi:eukaryotic-like serine/threonine-protein kinase